jgi:formylglycine-generating enzyme
MIAFRAMNRKTVLLGLLIVFTVVAGSRVVYRHDVLPHQTARNTCPLPDDSNTPQPGMVWIPAGQFLIGGKVYAEEGPISNRSVKGFWMDRTEVTNGQFAAFVAATGYVTRAEQVIDKQAYPNLPPDMQQPGAVVFIMPSEMRHGGDLTQWWRYLPGASWRHPDGPSSDLRGRQAHPVVAITYEDAMAYARWKGHDLPTEAEWEWAARAGQSSVEDTQISPPLAANTWQGFFPMNNLAEDGFAGIAPVGCYQANAYGLYDMIGNVWELTRDSYLPFHAQDSSTEAKPAGRGPYAAHAAAQHVIKGGSYLCAANYCMRYRAASRQGQEDDLAAGHVGFRTVFRSAASSNP